MTRSGPPAVTAAPPRRRLPDVAVDGLVAAATLLVTLVIRPDQPGVPQVTWPTAALAVVSCAALLARRRHPLLVLAATMAAGIAGIAVSGGTPQAYVATFVALYSVAAWRPRRVALVSAAAVAVTNTLLVIAYADILPTQAIYVLLAWTGMACAAGIAVRNRREFVDAMRERALRAEQSRDDEAQRRVTAERLRIARELHDVVAHHMAVISVQSGVARHLVTTDPEKAQEALGHVRQATDIVLVELATILGLLRTTEDDAVTDPAPGLARLDDLVDSMRRTGLAVTLEMSGPPVQLGAGADLTVYRLVQEALTNAGKHGSGSAEVRLDRRADVLSVVVSNPVADRSAPHQGTGHGLTGMRERVAALGGTLEAGPQPNGTFEVRARLPVGDAA